MHTAREVTAIKLSACWWTWRAWGSSPMTNALPSLLVLGAYERENSLDKALAFLKDLEDDGGHDWTRSNRGPTAVVSEGRGWSMMTYSVIWETCLRRRKEDLKCCMKIVLWEERKIETAAFSVAYISENKLVNICSTSIMDEIKIDRELTRLKWIVAFLFCFLVYLGVFLSSFLCIPPPPPCSV